MWHCPACEYLNEDWDDRCAKCGANPASPEPAPDDLDYRAEPQAAIESAAAAQPAKPKRGNPTALIIILVIAVSVIGLAAVGWYAWQLGLIQFNLPASTADDAGQSILDSGLADIRPQAVGEVPTIPADSFEQLLAGSRKTYRPYRDVMDTLLQTRLFLASHIVPLPQAEGWSSAELSELAALADQSRQLLSAYREFVELAAEHNEEKYAVARYVLVEEFTCQFKDVYELVGAYYAGDLTGKQSAYLLSDTIADTVDQVGGMDTQPLRTTWLRSTKQREQFLLDLALGEEFAQLNARISAAIEVQYQFRQTRLSLPTPAVRFDTINQGAEDLLALLDAYAFTWEDFGLEFEEYEMTLPERGISDQLTQQLDDYQQMIEDSHLFCFTEVYKFYAQDQDLHHDAYWNLETHLAFAELHWSGREGDYRAVYTRYTAEWDLAFRE